VHVQAFLQVDPPRRISALHLFAMPMSETIVGGLTPLAVQDLMQSICQS
jgi:hypothetical protein